MNADLIRRLRDGEWSVDDALKVADALEDAEARIKTLERLDSEAATHVESVICLRSGHFTGDPPYVGWKGLGLALNQDYDDLWAAETEAARLRAALEEAVEFAEQDFQALTPKGKVMIEAWRAALKEAKP